MEKTVTLRTKIASYHDSLAAILAGMDNGLSTRSIKEVTAKIVTTPSGSEVFLRTLLIQLFIQVLLEWVCETHGDLLIHEKSNIMSHMSNTMRFFVNALHVEGEGKAMSPQLVVGYLTKTYQSLLNGKISKDLKSKELLVPG